MLVNKKNREVRYWLPVVFLTLIHLVATCLAFVAYTIPICINDRCPPSPAIEITGVIFSFFCAPILLAKVLFFFLVPAIDAIGRFLNPSGGDTILFPLVGCLVNSFLAGILFWTPFYLVRRFRAKQAI